MLALYAMTSQVIAFAQATAQHRGNAKGLHRQPENLVNGIDLLDQAPGAPAELFHRAWVSALAAYNEAFGLVLVESLACGTPVVGMADGGVPEIVDRPGIGTLFDGSGEDLARALLETLELAEDPRTAERCRARAADFTTQRTATECVRLYEELIALLA